MAESRSPPVYSFTHDPLVEDFAVSKHAYLAARPGISFGYIATSTLVLLKPTPDSPARILLIQRAAGDGDPNKWEPPGGACEDEDETVLHGAARELWEEAGLGASRIVGTVGKPYFYTVDNDSKHVCQFQFAVEVKTDDEDVCATARPVVTLDPKEHQRYVWATAEEVSARRTLDGVELDFTREEVAQTVLLAFDHFEGRKQDV